MENRINIGEMDTLVNVYSATIDRTAQAAKKYVFEKHSTVFAKLEQNVDESVVDTNLASVSTVSATIYKIRELTTRWQIEARGIRYAITSIDPVSRMSPLCVLSLREV